MTGMLVGNIVTYIDFVERDVVKEADLVYDFVRGVKLLSPNSSSECLLPVKV